jgi:hypothetical protein
MVDSVYCHNVQNEKPTQFSIKDTMKVLLHTYGIRYAEDSIKVEQFQFIKTKKSVFKVLLINSHLAACGQITLLLTPCRMELNPTEKL